MTHRRHRQRSVVRSILMPLGLLILSACERIDPCGAFTFTGSAVDGAASNGIDMNVSFDFDPSVCGSSCTATKIAYVQIVRTYSFEDGTFSYISEEHQARAIESGWYVDRLTGRIWGYYGRNNDGTFNTNLQPGSNTTPAVLFDGPRRQDSMRQIWWQAVSGAVSIDGGANSCNNNFLGYYFWSWLVDAAGAVTDDYIIDAVAWEDQQLRMDEAVAAWNTQAPGLGHNLFPSFDKLMY